MPATLLAQKSSTKVEENKSTLESKWETNSAAPFTREAFLGLLEGKVPVMKVPSYVSADLGNRIVQHLLPSFTPYLHATGPAVEKVGLAQFEFQAQSAEDFMNRSGEGKIDLLFHTDLLAFRKEASSERQLISTQKKKDTLTWLRR